ncbi:tripartite tricarboxylate transporter TctB family protein [Cereibacter sp. SYSU M97828]|nr:tripartite tricarboxylate transporter TctB family protein [Cereibacter flavus]
MTLRTFDALAAAFLVLFGGYLVVTGIGYGVMSGTTPGSGLFPLAMGMVIGALSVVNLWRALTGREDLGEGMPRAELLRAAAVVAVLAGFVVAIPFMGMTIAAALMMLGIGLILAERRDGRMLARLVAVSVVVPAASLLVFDRVLNVPVPTGPLGF